MPPIFIPIMKHAIVFMACFFIFSGHVFTQATRTSVIDKGQMPDLVLDKKGVVHIAYGKGDSIMYTTSKDGRMFTTPTLVAVLPGVYSFAMRGPQIASTSGGLVITASTKTGNLFSFVRTGTGPWSKPKRVNEMEGSAKEGLTDLSADGENVCAIWLSVIKPKGQNLYAARSKDGGKTWINNTVYNSPDRTICECCKPSVVVKGEKVFVMFRNWIDGNRDMYLTRSSNSGKRFDPAVKLGRESWKLNGCPMDGGGFTLNSSGIPETIWQRAGQIYTCRLNAPERLLGEGRNGTIENVSGKMAYAWADNGNIVMMKPDGLKLNIDKGSLPILKALPGNQVICVWQNQGQIYSSVVAL